jgi:hypothetical protein
MATALQQPRMLTLEKARHGENFYGIKNQDRCQKTTEAVTFTQEEFDARLADFHEKLPAMTFGTEADFIADILAEDDPEEDAYWEAFYESLLK